MDNIGPFTFNAVRFFVWFLAIVPLAFLFEVKKSEIDFISEVLIGLGSVSISYSDALDSPIYEPLKGEIPLWDFIRLEAIFLSEIDKNIIINSVYEICKVSVLEVHNIKNKVWWEPNPMKI